MKKILLCVQLLSLETILVASCAFISLLWTGVSFPSPMTLAFRNLNSCILSCYQSTSACLADGVKTKSDCFPEALHAANKCAVPEGQNWQYCIMPFPFSYVSGHFIPRSRLKHNSQQSAHTLSPHTWPSLQGSLNQHNTLNPQRNGNCR